MSAPVVFGAVGWFMEFSPWDEHKNEGSFWAVHTGTAGLDRLRWGT
jgi:hypothetical protein